MEKLFIDDLSWNFDKSTYINEMIETHNEILLELHYLSDFKNAKILRDFLEELLVQMKIPAQTVSRFILAGDELNNNAIEYGSAAGELNKMRVIVKKVEKTYSIQLEVEDTGTGEKSKTADEMRQKQKDVLEKWFRNHSSIRGRWLFMIIVKIMDELYFENSQKWWLIVWIKKDLLV